MFKPEPGEVAHTWKFRTVAFICLALVIPFWSISLPVFLYLAYRSYVSGGPAPSSGAGGAQGSKEDLLLSIHGTNWPKNGATASFAPNDNNGNPAAEAEITSQPQPTQKSGDRIPCPHCQKEIVPRIVTIYGRVDRSVCPFCGETVKNFSKWWHFLLDGLAR